MKMLRFSAALSLALVLGPVAAMAEEPAAAPAAGGTSTTTVAPPVSAAADPDSVVICKNFAPATGTMIGGRRICKTHHEWALEEGRARDLTGGIQSRGLTSMPTSSGGH